MGYSADATGKPAYAPTPTQTVADLQAAVDYAEKVGGLLKVTAAERTSLTSAQTKPGWIISETDTGELYLVTAESPQGSKLATGKTVFAHAGKTGGFQTMSGGQVATIALQDAVGGFTLEDNALVVPVTGRYQVTCRFYYSGAGGGTVLGVLQINGAYRVNTHIFKEPGLDTTSTSTQILSLTMGDKLRLWSNYGSATWGTNGYDGLFVEALRVG